MAFISPVLVGRRGEQAALWAAVRRATQHRGGATLVVGEPGIGKSRLTAQLTAGPAGSRVPVLRGRAGGVPFRALAEAVHSAQRRIPDLDLTRLGPYGPVLARLAPGGGSDPLVVRGEAVLRLLAEAGGSTGVVLLLEDLHEADPESLAVVDYLIDNIVDQRALLVGTLRPEPGPAMDLVTRATARRAAEEIRLAPLDRSETAQLAACCLGGPVPPEVLHRLHRDADGVPFVVEELLGAMVDGGVLTGGSGGWVVTDAGTLAVPATLAAAVLQRTDRLGPDAVRLLEAAAVLGRTFSLRIAAAVARLSLEEAVALLRLAYGAQLVCADADGDADRHAFRHGLTADAILSRLLPADRASRSRTAAAALESMTALVDQGDDQPHHAAQQADHERLAAVLWSAGGEPVRAAELYLRAGRRAVAQGALSTAVDLLERGLAETLTPRAATTGRAVVATRTADILAELSQAYVLTGDTARVFELGTRLDAALSAADAPPGKRAAAHLLRARAAAVAGASERGLKEVELARSVVLRDCAGGTAATLNGTDQGMAAAIDAVAANLLLGSSRPDRLTEAMALAGRAVAEAVSVPLPEIACEALEVLSRCTCSGDFAAARSYAERALSIAEAHRLPIWRVRALLNLGVIDKYVRLDPTMLLAARAAAQDTGAVVTLAWIDLHLANTYIHTGELDDAAVACTRAADLADQLGLSDLALLADGVTAGIAAARGAREEMEQALSRLAANGGSVLGYGDEVWAHCRAMCALLGEEHDRALEEFRRAAVADRSLPAIRGSGFQGPYLLLRVVKGQAGWPEHDELAGSPVGQVSLHRPYLMWTRAVLLGRAGRADDARAAAHEAILASATLPAPRYLGMRLVAESAIADGWGEPVTWLREAEEHWYRTGVDRIAAACRALLRLAGAPPGPRRRGHDEIPTQLRRDGVTVREFEVLRLLADRMGNVEIAEQLFLSPRTVERHVGSLRARTGLSDRAELVGYARRHLAQG